jgi:hypothetical protein
VIASFLLEACRRRREREAEQKKGAFPGGDVFFFFFPLFLNRLFCRPPISIDRMGVVVTSAGVLAVAAFRGEQYLLLRLAGGSGGGGGAAWDTPPPAPAAGLLPMQTLAGGISKPAPSTTSGSSILTPTTMTSSTSILPSAIGVSLPDNPDAAILKRAVAEATQVSTGVELLEFVSDEFIDVRSNQFFSFLRRWSSDRGSFFRSTGLARKRLGRVLRTKFSSLFPSCTSLSLSLSLSLSCLSRRHDEKSTPNRNSK